MKNKTQDTSFFKVLSSWKNLKLAWLFSLLFLFFGGLAVSATFPPLPSGATSSWGWLGEIFNLTESGSGQLALNSKKIVLPEDYAPITDNKQLATKEYVDQIIVAGGNTWIFFYQVSPTSQRYKWDLGWKKWANAKCKKEFWINAKMLDYFDFYRISAGNIGIFYDWWWQNAWWMEQNLPPGILNFSNSYSLIKEKVKNPETSCNFWTDNWDWPPPYSQWVLFCPQNIDCISLNRYCSNSYPIACIYPADI